MNAERMEREIFLNVGNTKVFLDCDLCLCYIK